MKVFGRFKQKGWGLRYWRGGSHRKDLKPAPQILWWTILRCSPFLATKSSLFLTCVSCWVLHSHWMFCISWEVHWQVFVPERHSCLGANPSTNMNNLFCAVSGRFLSWVCFLLPIHWAREMVKQTCQINHQRKHMSCLSLWVDVRAWKFPSHIMKKSF